MDRNPQIAEASLAAFPTWSVKWRIIASLALGWHLIALLIGPISLPPSILGQEARTAARGLGQAYLEAMFLDHAYKFFAPEPGPSHLVHYELTLADGRRTSGVFPNLDEQWPRLLYHRHFMLSETLGAFALPPDLDQNLAWDRLPLSEQQAAFVRSFARRLKAEHSPRELALYLVQHRFPSPEEFESGMKLDDERLYRRRLLYQWRETPAAPLQSTLEPRADEKRS